jgi:hypothetical protein
LEQAASRLDEFREELLGEIQSGLFFVGVFEGFLWNF